MASYRTTNVLSFISSIFLSLPSSHTPSLLLSSFFPHSLLLCFLLSCLPPLHSTVLPSVLLSSDQSIFPICPHLVPYLFPTGVKSEFCYINFSIRYFFTTLYLNQIFLFSYNDNIFFFFFHKLQEDTKVEEIRIILPGTSNLAYPVSTHHSTLLPLMPTLTTSCPVMPGICGGTLLLWRSLLE